MKTITIRRMRLEDAVSVTRIHRNTIRAINRKHYNARQIHVWSSRISATWLRSHFKEELHFVAVRHGSIVGFINISLDAKVVHALYVQKNFLHRGIGRQLMQRVEREAQRRGNKSLTLNATITGKPFYERIGFHVIRRTRRHIASVSIPGFIMRKRLPFSVPTYVGTSKGFAPVGLHKTRRLIHDSVILCNSDSF